MSSRRFQLATWVQSLASDPQPGTCPTPTHLPPPTPVPQGRYLWPSGLAKLLCEWGKVWQGPQSSPGGEDWPPAAGRPGLGRHRP